MEERKRVMGMIQSTSRTNSRTYLFEQKVSFYAIFIILYIINYLIGYPGGILERMNKALSMCFVIIGLMAYAENTVYGNLCIGLYGLSQYAVFNIEIGEIILIIGMAGVMISLLRVQFGKSKELKPVKLNGITKVVYVMIIISVIASIYSGIRTGTFETAISIRGSMAHSLELAVVSCIVYIVYMTAMANLNEFYFIFYVNCIIDILVLVGIALIEPRGIYLTQIIERIMQVTIILIQLHNNEEQRLIK